MPNIFNDVPESLSDELIEIIAKGEGVRIERILSTGQRSPDGFWYDQDEHEWVIVLQGEAQLTIEGRSEPIRLGAGDHLELPAHCRHRVEWTSPDQPTIWLAVFYRPETDGKSVNGHSSSTR